MDYNRLFYVKKNQFGGVEFSSIPTENDNVNKIAYFLVLKINDFGKINEVKRLMSIKFTEENVKINAKQRQKAIEMAETDQSLYKTKIILDNNVYWNDLMRDLAQMHALTNLLIIFNQNEKRRIHEESNVWYNTSGLRIEDFDTNQELIITNNKIYYINGFDSIPIIREIPYSDFLLVFKLWQDFFQNNK